MGLKIDGGLEQTILQKRRIKNRQRGCEREATVQQEHKAGGLRTVNQPESVWLCNLSAPEGKITAG